MQKKRMLVASLLIVLIAIVSFYIFDFLPKPNPKPKGWLMEVFGTEYIVGDEAKIWLQLLDNDKVAINNATCYVTAYYPNNTKLFDLLIMNHLPSSDGLYYYDLTAPSVEGVYMVSGLCHMPSDAFFDDFLDYSNLENYTNITISGGKIVLGTYLEVQEGNVSLSPVGWWHLNENSGTTAYDSSGYGHDGLLSAGGWTTGKLNNCWTNSGADTGITVSGFGDYEKSESFSAEAWIKTSSVNSQTILGRMEDTGNGRGWGFTVASNKAKVQLRNVSGGQISALSYVDVNDNNWHHVVMTYNGNSSATGINVYVDGVENTTNRSTGLLAGSIKNSAIFSMGSRNLKQIFFYGKIDEVAVYDKVLNQSEISFRYNSSFGSEQKNNDIYITRNTTTGNIRSNPIDLTMGAFWNEFNSTYSNNSGSISFKVLNNSNAELCSGLGDISSCTGSNSPIKLYAEIARPASNSTSPEIDNWWINWILSSIEEIRGAGEMHIKRVNESIPNVVIIS